MNGPFFCSGILEKENVVRVFGKTISFRILEKVKYRIWEFGKIRIFGLGICENDFVRAGPLQGFVIFFVMAHLASIINFPVLKKISRSMCRLATFTKIN